MMKSTRIGIALAAMLMSSSAYAADAYNLNISPNANYNTNPVTLSCVTDGSSPLVAAPCGNAANPINVTGDIAVDIDPNAATNAEASVASPTRTEGTQVPLSVDLKGNLRIIGCDTTGACVSDINGTSSVGGNVADDAADTGNPIPIGCHAEATTTNVNADDRSRVSCDLAGQVRTTPPYTGATAAAPPASAAYIGANGSGATGGLLAGLKMCDTHAKYDASDTGSITMVTGVSGRKVYICGFLMATGGTATNLKLREGSDANCATNGADLTPAYQLVANDRVGMAAAFWSGLVVSTNAYYVCINASAANAHQAEVWYTIQ